MNAGAPSARPARPTGLWWRLWHGASHRDLRCAECRAALDVNGLAPGSRVRCGCCGSVVQAPGNEPDTQSASTSIAGSLEAKLARKPSSHGLSDTQKQRILEAPPKQLGVYVLEQELARGGTAVVYRARHERLGKPVAVKLLLPTLDDRQGDGEMNRRLFREALTLARFRHPNIVPVLDAGQSADGLTYLVMEYVSGEDLARRLKRQGRMESADALSILAQVIEGVDFAHVHGVVHRDLKPANVLLDPDGNAQLVDFGLARDESAGSRLTQSGVALGTPAYMPPEQAKGERDAVGPRSDIYSLGAILYEALTGRPPFGGEQVMNVLYQVVHDDPPPPRRLAPSIPREAEAICLKAMEKDPAARYASAHQMLQDVRAVLDGQPPPVAWAARGGPLSRFLRRRGLLGWKGAAILLVALLLVGGLAERRERARKVRAAIHDGGALLEQGEFEAAEEKFVEALRLDPDHPEAFAGRFEVKRQREEAEAQRKDEERARMDAERVRLEEEMFKQFAERLGKVNPLQAEAWLKGLGRTITGAEVQDHGENQPARLKVLGAPRMTCRIVLPQTGEVLKEGAVPLEADLQPGVYLIRYRSSDGTEGERLVTVHAREEELTVPLP